MQIQSETMKGQLKIDEVSFENKDYHIFLTKQLFAMVFNTNQLVSSFALPANILPVFALFSAFLFSFSPSLPLFISPPFAATLFV